MVRFKFLIAAGSIAALMFCAMPAAAVTVGVTDKEIVIGATGALSGAASAYSSLTRGSAGYYNMVNAQGGVNGRQIRFLLRDDAYSPPRTVEQTRKLVEQDKVAFMAGQQGSLTSAAVKSYLNDAKVPQMFTIAALSAFNDPKNYPWTTVSLPSAYVEGRMTAAYILKTNPNSKIAFLLQNDDAGRDWKRGLTEGLGPEKSKAITEVTFEISDPSVDSQVLTLSQSKADAFIIVGPPKATTQAIRRAYDTDWRPATGLFIASYATSIENVLTPAGLDKSKGLIAPTFLKDPSDPRWADDESLKNWAANMNKYNPGVPHDALARMGWLTAQMVVQAIKQAGNDLSRENLMKQATNIKMDSELLLPGVTISTSPTNFGAIQTMRLQQFDGTRWNLVP